MKKLLVIVSLLLITMVMLFGCGKTDNSATTQNVIPPQEYNKTFTLQGKIMDAVTGAPIGNDPVDPTGALQVFLIQGDADRGPTKLHSNPNDPLVGEYSFSGIPADRTAGEVVFKVIVQRKGYQDFAANVGFDATITAGANTVNFDGTLNQIGNIYLFPIGATPGDVTVNVFSPHGVPVPGVTVLLQQDVVNNGVTAITGDRLVPVAGLNPSMTVVTDTNGVATFSGATLVLGGSYNAVAEAIDFQGDELAATKVGNFIIGTNTRTQPINMGVAGTAFFAVSASNAIPGTITPSGVLTITFNEPITLTTTFFSATLLASNGTLSTPQATGSVGLDGVTLTLTPNFVTAPTATALGATITYDDLVPGTSSIILTNTQTAAPALNAIISKNTGTLISRTVQLIAN